MTGWQPIETAPKNFTELLGYRPDQGVFIFRWSTVDEFPDADQTDDYECWWNDLWGWMDGELTPTHWMPLPSPPEDRT